MPFYMFVLMVDDVESGILGTYLSSYFTLNIILISIVFYMIFIINTDGQMCEIVLSEIALGKTGVLNYIIDVDISVLGLLFIGVFLGIEGVGFYKGGNQGVYFNLDFYEGYMYKKLTMSDKWYVFFDGVEVTELNWMIVFVFDGQFIWLFFDEVLIGNSYEYLFIVKGGVVFGWLVKLINGEI